MSSLCLYTVAKFIPDLVRNEPRNIGVLIFNEQTKEYKSRFANNIRNKVGKAMSSDIEIIREYNSYFKTLIPNTKEDIVKSTSSSSGKIQFTEIRGVVTKDIDKELEYLFSLFVGEENISPIKKHRLKTTIKNNFKEFRLLGEGKIVADKHIEGGKSNVNHRIDFSHQNGVITAIEAVDFSIIDRKTNIFETAFKFEDLIIGLGKRKVNTYSIIKTSDNHQLDAEYLSILKSVSTVYNANQSLSPFLTSLKKVVK